MFRCLYEGWDSGTESASAEAQLCSGELRRTCLIARIAETDSQERMMNTTSSFSWARAPIAIVIDHSKKRRVMVVYAMAGISR